MSVVFLSRRRIGMVRQCNWNLKLKRPLLNEGMGTNCHGPFCEQLFLHPPTKIPLRPSKRSQNCIPGRSAAADWQWLQVFRLLTRYPNYTPPMMLSHEWNQSNPTSHKIWRDRIRSLNSSPSKVLRVASFLGLSEKGSKIVALFARNDVGWHNLASQNLIVALTSLPRYNIVPFSSVDLIEAVQSNNQFW